MSEISMADLAWNAAQREGSARQRADRDLHALAARVEAIELHVGLRRPPQPPQQVTAEAVAKLTGLQPTEVERVVAACNLLLRGDGA